MFFCPTCANYLLLDPKTEGKVQFYCKSCNYICRVRHTVEKIVNFEAPVSDLVIGGRAEWENADQTSVLCPKCKNDKAYFRIQQIRSADEPSTVFYRCTSCSYDWVEN